MSLQFRDGTGTEFMDCLDFQGQLETMEIRIRPVMLAASPGSICLLPENSNFIFFIAKSGWISDTPYTSSLSMPFLRSALLMKGG